MDISIKLPVSIFKENGKFIAYTPALDLSTSSNDYEEVKKRFSEAVNIFFEYTTKKGTLEPVLKDLGWKKVKKQWTPPTIISQGVEEVKIPACV